MSRQLAFWRQEQDGLYPSPHEIFVQASKVRHTDDYVFEQLPDDTIRKQLKQDFSSWLIDIEDAVQIAFLSKDRTQSVLVEKHGNLYVASCSYNVSFKDLNKIINIFIGFGCALYDVETDERFLQPL